MKPNHPARPELCVALGAFGLLGNQALLESGGHAGVWLDGAIPGVIVTAGFTPPEKGMFTLEIHVIPRA